ncbi:TOMM precursor leader peptide-binding protein, partial [Streptomyces sp. B1866]|uniref:TOMM precursor leader peptide-binding protein n=1 Tax=Streptomyces sp. B1866 TaxID=3075431 RepID=UPI00288DAC77
MPPLGFGPHLRVEQVPGEAVYLVSERGVTALRGGPVAALAPLLDGSRDLAGVLADAAGAVPADQAARVIARLSEAGLVSERGPTRATSAEEAYWALAGLGPAAADRASPDLARPAAVTPVTLGSTDPGEVGQALRAAGLASVRPPAWLTGQADGTAEQLPGRTEGAAQHAPSPDPAGAVPHPAGAAAGCPPAREHDGRPEGAALTLVVCDDYLDPRLAALDAAHRAAGRRWLPVKPVGTEAWIGPFLGAPDGPCWSCLADRLWRRRRAEAYLQHRLGRTGPAPHPPASLPASRAAALQLAALESATWLAGHRHPGQGSLRTWDSLTSAGEAHPVLRRPQCPACGRPGLVAARVTAPLRLGPDGADRPRERDPASGRATVPAPGRG